MEPLADDNIFYINIPTIKHYNVEDVDEKKISVMLSSNVNVWCNKVKYAFILWNKRAKIISSYSFITAVISAQRCFIRCCRVHNISLLLKLLFYYSSSSLTLQCSAHTCWKCTIWNSWSVLKLQNSNKLQAELRVIFFLCISLVDVKVQWTSLSFISTGKKSFSELFPSPLMCPFKTVYFLFHYLKSMWLHQTTSPDSIQCAWSMKRRAWEKAS